MLYVLIKDVLFYREVSTITAFIIIINHIHSWEQLEEVNYNFIIILNYINILLFISLNHVSFVI